MESLTFASVITRASVFTEMHMWGLKLLEKGHCSSNFCFLIFFLYTYLVYFCYWRIGGKTLKQSSSLSSSRSMIGSSWSDSVFAWEDCDLLCNRYFIIVKYSSSVFTATSWAWLRTILTLEPFLNNCFGDFFRCLEWVALFVFESLGKN